MYQQNEKLLDKRFAESAYVNFTQMVVDLCSAMKGKEISEGTKYFTKEFDLSKAYRIKSTCVWNYKEHMEKEEDMFIIQKNDKFAFLGVIEKPIIESINYLYRLEDLEATNKTIF